MPPDGGQIFVANDQSLGDATLKIGSGLNYLKSTSPVDPLLNNPITITGGSLTVQGLLTFSQGVSVGAGTALDITGTGTQVAIQGR